MADLVKKLLLRPGQQVVILNAPAGYLERLTPLPDGVDLRSRAGPAADFVQVFAKNQAELERLAPEALATLRPGAILWIAYPKKSAKVATNITRDSGWDTLRRQGWRPVTQIAIDETWSALCFRPESEVR